MPKTRKTAVTFAEKVRKAIKNCPNLNDTIRQFNAWKYIIKGNPNFSFRYKNGSLFVYEKSKNVVVDCINRHGYGCIGYWINEN